MALAVLFSCTEEDLPEPDPEPEPPQKQEEKKPYVPTAYNQIISFEEIPAAERPSYTASGVSYTILSIEYTTGHRYIVRQIESTKAAGDMSVLVGTYNYKDSVFTSKGSFNAAVKPLKDGIVDITLTAGGKQTSLNSKGTIKTVKAKSTEIAQAFGNWAIDVCYITISGKGISLQRAFKGCNIYEMVKYAVDNGATVNPEIVAGYNLSELIFTYADSMAICFSGAPAFYGTYSLSGDDFGFHLVVGNKELMDANVKGKLTFPEKGKANLILSTTIDGFSGSLEFEMSKK